MATGPDELLRLARNEFAAGRLARSRELCEEFLGSAPDHPEGLHLRALLALSNGNAAAALSPIQRALRRDAFDPKKHQTHGIVLRALARRGEAGAAFREALRLSPQFAEAHASLALSQMDEGDFTSAARGLDTALRLRPDVYAWCMNLGLCRSSLGDAAAAVEAFQRAARLDARMPEAHNNLGTALLACGRVGEAEASFRHCIALAPGHSHAWTNLGNALRRSQRAREAEAAYRRATQCLPPLAIAWVNLGNALKDADRIDEAMECFAQATELAPDSPEAHLSRAIARLLVGDLARGWEEYRWRLGPPDDSAMRTRFEDAIRTRRPIEILGEQGLGDSLFFLRWVPALRAAGARLAFRGDARLFPLLGHGGWFDEFASEDGAGSDAVGLPAGDLPWLARAIAVAYPPPLPLKASGKALEAARSLLVAAGPPPYVGVAWRAGLPSADGTEHLHKMAPLESLGAAFQRFTGTLVSLQRGAEADELATLSGSTPAPVLDAGPVNSDLDAMLGLLASLDDYVGVSSTNVHLRAGLGLPARILVPLPPEWRYGRAGATSPWFPGFRLYRENRESGWQDAMGALASDLGRAP